MGACGRTWNVRRFLGVKDVVLDMFVGDGLDDLMYDWIRGLWKSCYEMRVV